MIETPSTTSPRRPALVAVALALILLATVAPLIISGRIPQRVFSDQRVYHEVAIRQFILEWPRFDFSNYASATTPGYHVVLATVGRFVSDEVWVLQAVSAAIACLFVGVFGWWIGRLTTPWRAIVFGLTLVCSMYVVQSGAWLMPDNIGWLGVLAVLMLALSSRFGVKHLGAAAVVLLLLVFVRQSHIWAAGCVWAAAWLAGPSRDGDEWWREFFSDISRRARWAMAGVIVSVPAFVLLWWFWKLWGGLTPPRFAQLHQGSINVTSPVFTLAVVGAFSGVFIVPLWGRLAAAWKEARWWLLGCAAAALVASLVVPTTYSLEAGRWGGVLWSVAAKFPALGHVSAPVVALAVFGAGALVAWLIGLPVRERLVILTALAGFSAAQAMNAQLWQRYVEPLALMVVIYGAAKTSPVRGGWWKCALPIAAAAVFAGVTMASAFRSPWRVHSPPPAAPGQAPAPVKP